MKTAEESAKEYADIIDPVIVSGTNITRTIDELNEFAQMDYLAGYLKAIMWRDPKEELPDWDMQVVIKGGILKPEIGLDVENLHCAGYYRDGVWYVSPTDYYSIEIENPVGWRPIE